MLLYSMIDTRSLPNIEPELAWLFSTQLRCHAMPSILLPERPKW